MPAVRWWGPCLLPCLAACGVPPDPEQMAREVQARHPGCAVIHAGTGEGDSDDVYMTIDLQCADGATRRFEALYQRPVGAPGQRPDDRWIYRSEREVDPASPHSDD